MKRVVVTAFDSHCPKSPLEGLGSEKSLSALLGFAAIFLAPTLTLGALKVVATTTPKTTATAMPTAILQPTYDAVSYGAVCDDRTDDSAAFKALFRAASAKCKVNGNVSVGQATVDFPPGKVCKLNSGITIDTGCVGLRGNGTTLDFSGIVANTAAVTTYDDDQTSPYNGNMSIIDLKLLGPGHSISNGTIGLLSGSSGTTYIDFTATGFEYGVEVGNYSWTVSWTNPQLFGDGTGWYCPPNLTDSGENMSIVNGVIYDDDIAIDTEGCEVNSTDTSFDFETESIANVALNGSGTLRLIDSHIEFDRLSSALFNLGGSNSYSYITADGGQWQSNAGSSPADFATVDDEGSADDGGWGPWVQINNVFMVGLWPSATCASEAGGSPMTCATGSNAREVKYLNDREHQGNILTSAPMQQGDVESEGGE
jgi:hypothetical protein